DISLRKEMEDQIKGSLDEKGVLLREIHHRVKNNLQIIISLFNLQSNYISNKNALRVLREGQDRIKSMALIHERFYQSDGLSKIDFDDYIYKLTENLFLSYVVDTRKINLAIQADKVSVDIDTAVPCGLIINELVSNSLKHAFEPDETGEIFIRFRELEKNIYKLVVGDTGKGVDPDFDFENTETLGMQLVSALTDQLDGKMNIVRDNGKGISFEIIFKKVDT
ncbi:MAG: diguanylate cyclase, partial [Bacteroidia bacterium]|nr:diguanylate cyclase [Bacteroidia bacterium]